VNLRRRVLLIAGAGLYALRLPTTPFAQQSSRVWRLGFLGAASAAAPGSVKRIDALREGLRALGYIEGKNLIIEYRWAENKYERLPALADELVRLNIDVIVTYGTPGTLAAKQSTKSIPIIMAIVGDAVLSGLVANLARPGGNVTGSSFFNPELAAKRLELLKEIMPRMKKAAALINADNPAMKPVLHAMQAVANVLKLELIAFSVRGPDEFEGVFSAMLQQRIDGVIVVEDAMLNAHSGTIAQLGLKKKMPVTGLPDLAQAGALMTYGVEQPPMFRRAAYFVDKIFKGAKPAELPVERATIFEMSVNLKTAKALGLTIPPAIMVRANQVIE
jgi:putative ABC transport system substrate-binding protein